jgi:HK97 family phage major capsid protein
MHRQTWVNGAQRLAIAAAGNTWPILMQGQRELAFLGYPVVISQVMPYPLADEKSLVLALFGDLGMAVDMGVRRGTSIAFSDSALNAFEKDELIIKGTERFDIVVHDIGTATVAGPVVALIGKAS